MGQNFKYVFPEYLYSIQFINGNLEAAEILADRLLTNENDNVSACGKQMKGVINFHKGSFLLSKTMFSDIHKGNYRFPRPGEYSYYACTEMVLGNINNSYQILNKAIDSANDQNDVNIKGHALHIGTFINFFIKDFNANKKYIETGIKYCEKNNIKYSLGIFKLMQLHNDMKINKTVNKLNEFECQLKSLDELTVIAWPLFHTEFADGLLNNGHVSKALQEIDTIYAVSRETGEIWYLPITLCVHAKCLESNNQFEEANVLYLKSIEEAQRSGAKLFELSSAIAYHKFLLKYNQSGIKYIESIFNKFPKDSDFLDYNSAKTILNSGRQENEHKNLTFLSEFKI